MELGVKIRLHRRRLLNLVARYKREGVSLEEMKSDVMEHDDTDGLSSTSSPLLSLLFSPSLTPVEPPPFTTSWNPATPSSVLEGEQDASAFLLPLSPSPLAIPLADPDQQRLEPTQPKEERRATEEEKQQNPIIMDFHEEPEGGESLRDILG